MFLLQSQQRSDQNGSHPQFGGILLAQRVEHIFSCLLSSCGSWLGLGCPATGNSLTAADWRSYDWRSYDWRSYDWWRGWAGRSSNLMRVQTFAGCCGWSSAAPGRGGVWGDDGFGGKVAALNFGGCNGSVVYLMYSGVSMNSMMVNWMVDAILMNCLMVGMALLRLLLL